MRRSLIVAMLTLTLAVRALAEPISEVCCACLPSAGAPAAPAAKAPPPLVPAFFCRLVVSPDQEKAFLSSCDGVNGETSCVPPDDMLVEDNVDCNERFLNIGVLCPATKPVPTAGPPLLGALVAVLAGLGVWAARRRRRSAR